MDNKSNKKYDKRLMIKLKLLVAQNDIDLAYSLNTIYDYITNDLRGVGKKSCYYRSKISDDYSLDAMFLSFKNEVSPDGDFARDYLNDDQAPKDGESFLNYLIDYVDNDKAVVSYFNIIQRAMDENPNYSLKRINNIDLCGEVAGYLENYLENDFIK